MKMANPDPSTSSGKSTSAGVGKTKAHEEGDNSRPSTSEEVGKDKPVYRGPEGNKIFKEDSLKRLKIHIYTKVKKKPLKTEIVNPEEIKPVRRPNEGKVPIFSKIPIEEVKFKDEDLESVKKTLDKNTSPTRSGESSRGSKRNIKSRSPDKDRDRRTRSSERRSRPRRSSSPEKSRSRSNSSHSDHKSRRRRRRSRSDDSSSDSRSSRSRSRERRGRSRSRSRDVRRSSSRSRRRSRERRIEIRRSSRSSSVYGQGPSGPRDPRLPIRNPRPNQQPRWRPPMVPFYPPPVFFGPPGPFRGPGPPLPGYRPPRFFPPY